MKPPACKKAKTNTLCNDYEQASIIRKQKLTVFEVGDFASITTTIHLKLKRKTKIRMNCLK